MSFLMLPPREALLRLINQRASSPLALSDIMEIFPPVAVPEPLEGQGNTQVTIKTTLDASHAGRETFTYDRIDLALFTPYQINTTIEDIGTQAQFLAMLTRRYGFQFENEVEAILPFDVSGGELSYPTIFRAKPTSLVWTGEFTAIVHVRWRLTDPEWVEMEADRLRTLLNVSLPLSLSTFMTR